MKHKTTTKDIVHQQNKRIQRELLKQENQVDNNKVIGVIFTIIAIMVFV